MPMSSLQWGKQRLLNIYIWKKRVMVLLALYQERESVASVLNFKRWIGYLMLIHSFIKNMQTSDTCLSWICIYLNSIVSCVPLKSFQMLLVPPPILPHIILHPFLLLHLSVVPSFSGRAGETQPVHRRHQQMWDGAGGQSVETHTRLFQKTPGPGYWHSAFLSPLP